MPENVTKYRRYSLRNDNYSLPEIDNSERDARRIITGKVNIDYSVFKHTSDEKLRLKIEKSQCKLSDLKK
jgi:hypothetical protein